MGCPCEKDNGKSAIMLSPGRAAVVIVAAAVVTVLAADLITKARQ
jgi:hypothetical protein